jgi:hypothetical protein
MTKTNVRTLTFRDQPSAISHVAVLRRHVAAAVVAALLFAAAAWAADPPLPELTEPVNDFAHVVDSASASEIVTGALPQPL